MKEQLLGSDNLFVQSLAKGIGLLEALGARPGALSLTDLADLTGMDRSTTQRMTHTLVQLGYIEKGANGRGFGPGPQDPRSPLPLPQPQPADRTGEPDPDRPAARGRRARGPEPVRRPVHHLRLA